MFSQITRQASQQIAAFGLASVLTLSILGSINLLATQPVTHAPMAAQQHVVVTPTA